MALFAISITAMSTRKDAQHETPVFVGGVQHATAIFADSVESAEEKGTTRAINLFPLSEGYLGHGVVAHEIPFPMIVRAWREGGADDSTIIEAEELEM